MFACARNGHMPEALAMIHYHKSTPVPAIVLTVSRPIVLAMIRHSTNSRPYLGLLLVQCIMASSLLIGRLSTWHDTLHKQ